MAIITCKDCNKEFSTDARRCPHCGAKKPRGKAFGYVLLFSISLLLIAQCKGQQLVSKAQHNNASQTSSTDILQAPPYPDDTLAKAKQVLEASQIDNMAIASALVNLRALKRENDAAKYDSAKKLIDALEAKRNDPKQDDISAILMAVRDTAGNEASSEVVGGHWMYRADVSEMDDSETATLWLEADNSISAWLSTVHPVLYVRCEEHKTSVFILTNTAPQPELGRYGEASVRIRFGKNPAIKQLWTESTDNEALFAPNAITLAKQIAKSKEMAFEFVPFNSPSAIVHFTTTGLDKHLDKVAKACKWKP